MKVTVNYYLNKSLKPLDISESTFKNIKRVIGSFVSQELYHPLYMRVRCNGQQAQLKSKYQFLLKNDREFPLLHYRYEVDFNTDYNANLYYLRDKELEKPNDLLSEALEREVHLITCIVNLYARHMEKRDQKFKLSDALKLYDTESYLITVQEVVSNYQNILLHDFLINCGHEDLANILDWRYDSTQIAQVLIKYLSQSDHKIKEFASELRDVKTFGHNALSEEYIWLPEYVWENKHQLILNKLLNVEHVYGENIIKTWTDIINKFEDKLISDPS